MSIILKRLYLENYKLFEKRTILFGEALTVFDGPNGYGKTSTFDAIELLITGLISRVTDSDAINGTEGFGESFLSNIEEQDVVIKGEFYNSESDERLVIARRIPHVKHKKGKTVKALNPKSTFESVQTAFPDSFDQPQKEWKLWEKEEARAQCDRFFGAQNINMYTMLHYVRQEDRLEFFNQSEAERTKVITRLLGLEEYEAKKQKAQTTLKKLKAREKTLDKDIAALRKALEARPDEAAEQVGYIPAAGGKPLWDREDLGFRGADSAKLKQQLLEQVETAGALYRHRREFRTALDTAAFRAMPEDRRAMAVLAWRLRGELDDLRAKKRLLDFCRKQEGYLLRGDAAAVDWKQLCALLGAAELEKTFTALVGEIKNARKNQTELNNSLKELDSLRERLRDQARKVRDPEDGTCPYCGQDWGSSARLEEQFETSSRWIRSVLGSEDLRQRELEKQCVALFRQRCGTVWEKLRRKLERDVALQIFCRYAKWQDFQNDADACAPAMVRLELGPDALELGSTPEEALSAAARAAAQAEGLWTSLSPEYVALEQKADLAAFCRDNFGSPEALEYLSAELFERKRAYICWQYLRSFDESQTRLRRAEERKAALTELCGQLKDYSDTLNGAINAYRKQVIDRIEIPFFLYSSRLLQSYHGGQGVMISTTEGSKVRFVAPGREHDVFYTMSSGQLTAVLLAFTLSLNLIYAGRGFRTLLIDDPIQCMDDINMVSLVELLGREFGDSQVILSTHEDSFSRFIGYKYEKYGLNHASVSLKDG